MNFFQIIFSIFCTTIIFLSSCEVQEDDGWPPVARVFAEPAYVPKGQTSEITLDARKSCDALDYPSFCDASEDGDGCPSICPGGITYSWNIPGKTGNIRSLTNTYSLINVDVNIDRPVEIILTVTDCDGKSASKSIWLGITESTNNSPDANNQE
ncbi:MAG: hypothetical protein ACQES9_05530 [Myxococcota bacterium]